MNAAKSGLQSWMKRRALPLNKQHVGGLVEAYGEGLIACKGGRGVITEVTMAAIENAKMAKGAALLVMEEAKARGFVREVESSWDLAPGFAKLMGFLNCERQALALIGLGRIAKDVGSLYELLADEEDSGA